MCRNCKRRGNENDKRKKRRNRRHFEKIEYAINKNRICMERNREKEMKEEMIKEAAY